MPMLFIKLPPREEIIPVGQSTTLLRQARGGSQTIIFNDTQTIREILVANDKGRLVAAIDARAHEVSVNGDLVELDYQPYEGDEVEIL